MALVCILDNDKDRRESSAELVRASLNGRWPGEEWSFATDMRLSELDDVIRAEKPSPFRAVLVRVDTPHQSRDEWKALCRPLTDKGNFLQALPVIFWIDWVPTEHAFDAVQRCIHEVLREGPAVPHPFVWVFPDPAVAMTADCLAYTLRFLVRASDACPRIVAARQAEANEGLEIIKDALAMFVDLKDYSTLVSRYFQRGVLYTLQQWLRIAISLAQMSVFDKFGRAPRVRGDEVMGILPMPGNDKAVLVESWDLAIQAALDIRREMEELHAILQGFAADWLVDRHTVIPDFCVHTGIGPGPFLHCAVGVDASYDYLGDGLNKAKRLCDGDTDCRILVDKTCPEDKLRSKYEKQLGKGCFEPTTCVDKKNVAHPCYAVIPTGQPGDPRCRSRIAESVSSGCPPVLRIPRKRARAPQHG